MRAMSPTNLSFFSFASRSVTIKTALVMMRIFLRDHERSTIYGGRVGRDVALPLKRITEARSESDSLFRCGIWAVDYTPRNCPYEKGSEKVSMTPNTNQDWLLLDVIS